MNVVIIGAQWGDEGKGKIVDYLAERASIVVRFSGGANAGHTIVKGETTYKLHLIPSGIVYPDTKVVLGSAMVIDLKSMFEELAVLVDQEVSWQNRVFISDRAHIVLPRYREQDLEIDKKRHTPIGTTGRGIGITYAIKAGRDGIRLADLYDESMFRLFNDEDKKFLEPYREKCADMIINMAYFMEDHKDENIMFEGAQGSLLDLDIGTYPFVSSGPSAAHGASIGGGIGPKKLDKILGVFKAYTTRVGNGPFPSEFREGFDEDLAGIVRERGREYGVTTGRPRRCGYLDLVALKYACLVNAFDALVLTHLDVYDKMDEIKACVAYNIDGNETTVFPSAIDKLERATPVTKTFPGWKKDIDDFTDYKSLPKQAKEYLDFIENYVQTQIDIVSVGYRRRQTILRKDPWIK